MLNRNEKKYLVQATMLAMLNSCILMFFNFNSTFANDWRGICNATITVSIPLIMNVYNNEERSYTIKQNFDNANKRIRFSLVGASGIGIVILFEYLMEYIISKYTSILYLFFHGIELYIAYMLLILSFSLVLEPWLYLGLFKIDDKIN